MPVTPLFARRRTHTQSPLPAASKAAFAALTGYPDRPLAAQGDMSVRLAVTAKEVAAAQALRYRIFYKNMGAQAKFGATFAPPR